MPELLPGLNKRFVLDNYESTEGDIAVIPPLLRPEKTPVDDHCFIRTTWMVLYMNVI